MSKVSHSLKKSVSQFEKILGKRKSPKKRFLSIYLKHPIIFDCVSILFILAVNCLVEPHFTILKYTTDALSNILNECISSAMSLGGFILAAMAIVASMKQDVPIMNSDRALSAKDYFFNTNGYTLLMKSFTGACIIYSISFLYFSLVRAAIESLPANYLFNLTFFGLLLSVSTLFRCIWLIYTIIHLSSLPLSTPDTDIEENNESTK